MKNVKYGKCVRCGKTYEATPNLTNCQCGGILDIVYDYDYIKSVLTKEKLARRENRSMWRYRELLPVEETTPDTPLRVGWSPLYDEPNLARALGIRKLWVKDDGQNPTASLKDRASAMAVAKAYEAGAKTIACSSTGNAASSLAGNAAAAGFKTYIFVPERAPNRAIQENKPWEPMEENTIADSISVGVPRNADKALAAIRESKGLAICVTDEEILAAQRLLGRTCGVFGEPAGVTGTAALKKACEQGLIEKDATVVSVVTGNGLKDVANAIKSAGEPLHIEPDLDLMVKGFAQRGVTVE